MTNWYEHGGGQQLHDELGEIFNLKGLLAGNSGSQSGGWFRNEINSAADFNGLKFRMPGLGGKVLGKLGASVQNIPGGELYQALVFGRSGRSGVGWSQCGRTRRLPGSCKSVLHSWFPRAGVRFGVFRQPRRLERPDTTAPVHPAKRITRHNARAVGRNPVQQRCRIGSSCSSKV